MAYRVNCILYRTDVFSFFLLADWKNSIFLVIEPEESPKCSEYAIFAQFLLKLQHCPACHTHSHKILLIKIHFIHTTILVSHRHSPYSTNQARSNNILRIINSIFSIINIIAGHRSARFNQSAIYLSLYSHMFTIFRRGVHCSFKHASPTSLFSSSRSLAI